MIRLDAWDGYLLSQLVATADAGPEHERAAGRLCAANAGRRRVRSCDVGAAPLPELGQSSGLGRLSERFGRRVFRAAGSLFHLDARNVFRRKFMIARTSGSYFVFDPPSIGVREVLEMMRAFHASVAGGLRRASCLEEGAEQERPSRR